MFLLMQNFYITLSSQGDRTALDEFFSAQGGGKFYSYKYDIGIAYPDTYTETAGGFETLISLSDENRGYAFMAHVAHGEDVAESMDDEDWQEALNSWGILDFNIRAIGDSEVGGKSAVILEIDVSINNFGNDATYFPVPGDSNSLYGISGSGGISGHGGDFLGGDVPEIIYDFSDEGSMSIPMSMTVVVDSNDDRVFLFVLMATDGEIEWQAMRMETANILSRVRLDL